MKILHLFFLVFITSCLDKVSLSSFVSVSGNHFILNGKRYNYLGTNFWYGLNLGAITKGGDRRRLIQELDHLQSLGVTNLRIMAASEGPNTEPYRMVPALQVSPGKYDYNVLKGLDFLLSEMEKRDMKAIMCLNNFWPWSGGMSQYLIWAGAAKTIPYPPPHPNGRWDTYQTFTAQFYSNDIAKKMYWNHVKFIVNRRNSITKKFYKDDPTIMAWQLANEPRGDKNIDAYRKWIHQTAELIKKLDSNHLVTTGSEGNTPYPSAGVNLIKDHSSKHIDYATMHIWVQNWSIYNPLNADESLPKSIAFALNYIDEHDDDAKKLGKPVVLEEFGISRDNNNHNPGSAVSIRDKFYKAIFDKINNKTKSESSAVQGVNFWAWGGLGRPNHPNGLWQAGDDFIGDPPHEHQGWYSVYDNDPTTLSIIKKYAKLISN